MLTRLHLINKPHNKEGATVLVTLKLTQHFLAVCYISVSTEIKIHVYAKRQT